MHQKVSLLFIAIILTAVTYIDTCSAAIFDTDAITSGRMPAGVSFDIAKPGSAELRVIREFAPCIKLDLRSKAKWTLKFGTADVKPGKTYTLAVTLASAAEAGQSKTSDLANFRPENQQKKAESLEGKGYGTLSVLGSNKEHTSLADLAVSPTSWKTLTVTFTVPSGISTIRPTLTGSGGGVFFIADMAIAEGNNPPAVFLPESQTLVRIQGGDPIPFSTIIKEGKKYSIYEPGEDILWTVEAPAGAAQYKGFEYKIIDPYGNVMTRGNEKFPSTVYYRPPCPGYYELVVKSVSDVNASSVFYDRIGAAVLSKVSDFPMGGNAFGMQCVPLDMARTMGATWRRGGITNWSDDVNETDPNKDFSGFINELKANHVMPLHHQNNICGQTNSEKPGKMGMEFLPADIKAYGESYKKLVGLGGGFVQNFEFWNEPEGRLGATPYWTIENLTKTLIAAHAGMKAANPNAKMALGSNVDMIRSIDRLGGKDAYEILVMHPYPWSVGGPWNTPEDGLVLEGCASVRQWLDSTGGKSKEIWSTEYGYTTGTTTSGCSELQQSQMNVRASLLQLAGGLSRICPFRADDVWFWGQVDGRFGLCRGNLTPKPCFVAYSVLIRAVRDLPYRGRFDVQKNLAALVFGNEKETVLVYWTDKQNKRFDINLSAASTQMEQFGKRTLVKKGLQHCEASQSVSYYLIPCGYSKFAAAQKVKFIPGYTGGIFDGNVKRKTWNVPVLAMAPKVDGKLNEWSGPAIQFEDPKQNLDASVRVAFASDKLYLMAKVRGDSPGFNPKDGAAIWNGDCVELYFSRKFDSRWVYLYSDSDFHLAIAPGVDGTNGKIMNVLSGQDPSIAGSEARYVRNASGGYDLEASIPLSFFNVENVRRGDKFAFDVQLAVAGKTEPYNRRLQMIWSGNGQDFISPYLWGNAVAATH